MRRETVGLGALAAVTFLAYAWSAHYWIDPVDEGYFLDLAERIVQGQLPYRDFTTYYTPGIFYLFAATFKLFGPSLLWPRYLMAALRAATAVLTYVLTRRVAPWPFALVPFTVTALLDNWPIEPEPHPSWPAIVLCLLTTEFTVRHSCQHRLRWLAAAGASAGACFLFKQNIGAFTALALGSYVVLRPRTDSSQALKIVQVLFALAVGAAVTLFLWSLMDGLLAGAVWLPALAALGLATREALRAPVTKCTRGLRDVLVEGTATLAPYVVLTTAWLVPLTLALGLPNVPFGLFLGDINQVSISSRFPGLSGGVRAIGLLAIWTPVLLARRRLTAVGAAVFLSVVLLLLPIWPGPRDLPTRDPDVLGQVAWLDTAFGTLHIYIPVLAAWAAIVAVVTERVRGPAVWYLLFGAIGWLSVFPRVDTLHALVSGPPLLVCGAYALWRAYAAVRRATLVPALLILPIAAIAAQLSARAATIVSPEPDMPRLAYAPLGIERAPVSVPANQASAIRDLVTYLQIHTAPGEPVFGYPVEPILNFLAERPNPTHFDHFIPGTLGERDFQDVIADLQRAAPRYIVWNHHSVLVWATDPTNRPLSDYIWECYTQVETFDQYLVLERRDDAC